MNKNKKEVLRALFYLTGSVVFVFMAEKHPYVTYFTIANDWRYLVDAILETF